MDNSPTITLRKGKTEIRIENAAAIIKKVNELYRSTADYDGWCYAPSWNTKQKLSEGELEKQRRWIESAKDWFKTEMFGGSSDFEVLVNTPPTVEPFDPSTNYQREVATEIQVTTAPQFQPIPQSTEPRLIQSVNKNAYEIRLEVLQEAINWLSLEVNMPTTVNQNSSFSSGDAVVNLAQKFYKFVENRR